MKNIISKLKKNSPISRIINQKIINKFPNFAFSINPNRVIELEKNTNIDNILKHKKFVK